MKNISEKKNIIENIQKEIEQSREDRIWIGYINALKIISEVVFTKSSSFILEMIQNAEDSGLGLNTEGEFEININEKRVKIIHNGKPFDEKDVNALCRIGSSKKPEQGTLGYLGIGFKSVLKVTDCPEIYSNGFQFKFDRSYWRDDYINTPWQVIPIWIEKPSEDIDPDKTTFIIPLREPSYNQIILKELEKVKTELFLFLRWLKRIKVVDEVAERSWVLENAGENEDGIAILKQDGQEQKFKFFHRTIETIPDWVKQDRLTQLFRANVTKRKIAIAFALNNNNDLAFSEDGAMCGYVCSFVMLVEAKSGAKFPIHADFLVQPGRETVNYEAKWNHWLVQEVTILCKEAIDCFKKHPKWKYQILPAFEFTKHETSEYENLFKPELIDPIEKFLEEDNCIPTKDEGWAKPSEVVRIDEEIEAIKGLIDLGLFREEEIASVFGGQLGLKLVHADVKDGGIKCIKKVSRFDFLNNADFIKEKSSSSEAISWFRSLYKWLNNYPVYYSHTYRRRLHKEIKLYHYLKLLLTVDKQLEKGEDVSFIDVSSPTLLSKDSYDELKQRKPIIHPKIISEVTNEEDRTKLIKFLTDSMHLDKLDGAKICKELLLPKILTNVLPPQADVLLEYTIFCRQLLGKELGENIELWILTKQNEIKPAKEVFFPSEFKPEQNWELHKQFVAGLNFISPEYIKDITDVEQLKEWRQFFNAGGVGDVPHAAVEDFAVNYSIDKLRAIYNNIKRVERRNYGYDLEAEKLTGEKLYVEVKGFSSDMDIVLTDNESKAADMLKDNFYLSVVTSIPNNPEFHWTQNPAKTGKKDTKLEITIPVSIWKIAPGILIK